jgi:hypothetical protein
VTTALPEISFGSNVRCPAQLERCNSLDVLLGIRDGAWQDTVSRVRSLPADSAEQKSAKIALPYCTWAGVFSRREVNGLLRHSGQCGVDLDGLGENGAIEVLQAAVADRFCLAAFRSTRGEGVRLLFRIPPCSPENHRIAFEQVAEHVRNSYCVEPDASGKDVSRASFVSFDRGLWFNVGAEILPINLPGVTQRVCVVNRCVTSSLYAGTLAETWPTWYGRHLASTSPRENGTAKTHHSLLGLGKALALHAERIKTPLTARLVDTACDAWLAEHARQGVLLRCQQDEYRRELRDSVDGCRRKFWFKSAADKWLRWTRHKDFPHDGLPQDKILFAIRQHCADAKNDEFFLGVRDAGLVASTSFMTAARSLCKLVSSGNLKRLNVKRPVRHAQTFKLLTPRATQEVSR